MCYMNRELSVDILVKSMLQSMLPCCFFKDIVANIWGYILWQEEKLPWQKTEKGVFPLLDTWAHTTLQDQNRISQCFYAELRLNSLQN